MWGMNLQTKNSHPGGNPLWSDQIKKNCLPIWKKWQKTKIETLKSFKIVHLVSQKVSFFKKGGFWGDFLLRKKKSCKIIL